MTSRYTVPEAGLTPDAGAGNSAPLGSVKTARRLPDDPFSGGTLVAVFDGSRELLYRKDVYFQAKLATAERIWFEKQDVYLLSFELGFMKSFSLEYRFRGADINLTVEKGDSSDCEPSITRIFPTTIAVDISEREIQDTNELTAGVGGPAGPVQLNTSATRTHFDKTNFKGSRKFHGLIKKENTACWRLYEEARSQSGISPVFRLVALVQCLRGDFKVQLDVSARIVKWPKLFGLHKIFFNSNFRARKFPPTTISSQTPRTSWHELYKKAEKLFPDNKSSKGKWQRGALEFKTQCERAKSFNDEEMKIIASFCEDFGLGEFERGVRATILAELKTYLAIQDESEKFLRRLEASMAISIPDEDEGSSQMRTKTADRPRLQIENTYGRSITRTAPRRKRLGSEMGVEGDFAVGGFGGSQPGSSYGAPYQGSTHRMDGDGNELDWEQNGVPQPEVSEHEAMDSATVEGNDQKQRL